MFALTEMFKDQTKSQKKAFVVNSHFFFDKKNRRLKISKQDEMHVEQKSTCVNYWVNRVARRRYIKKFVVFQKIIATSCVWNT